jgi:serine/threonine protein kinase
MAPEVAKECPYNNSVDVYSFGILLWELCSAEKPFFGYSSGKHMQQVVIGGERPKMDGVHTAFWPANLQWLMTRCWSPFPALRPPFSAIEQVLHDILDGNESVPQSLADHPTEEQKGENVAIEAPSGGFAGFFQPLSKRMERSGTVGSAVDIEPPKDGFKGLKPSSGGSSRNRSWGFGLRR